MLIKLISFNGVCLLIKLNLLIMPRASNQFKILNKNEVLMDPYIVGGAPVDIEQYPFACVVVISDKMCGGSIINSWTVLTAAHCFDFSDNVDLITIHAGSKHRHEETADKYYAVHLIVHEDYDQTLFSNDIALVFIDIPFKFSRKVQKAVLAYNDEWMHEESHQNKSSFTVIGWGMVSYKGPLSDLGLLMARMRFVSLEECARLHASTGNAVFTPDMFCLYGDGKRDTCSGDSGTGVFWRSLLVGVVSHGDGCAGKDKPSVYTNVFYFRDWIKENIEEYRFKKCENLTKIQEP